jgi:hypothetical protein
LLIRCENSRSSRGASKKSVDPVDFIVCCSLSIATVFRSRRLLQRVMSMGSFCVQDVHIFSFT